MWRAIRSRPVLTGVFVALLGVILLGGGIWLGSLGGSWYYAVAGLGLLATGGLLIAGRREALWLYAVVVAATVIWAVWEVGVDGWALLPRIVAFAVVGIWLAMPWVGGKLRDTLDRPPAPAWRWAGVAVCVALIVAVFAAGWRITDARFVHPGDIAAATPVADSDPDWRHYGRTPAGDRFSPAAQITPANVATLQPAWSLRTGDLPSEAETEGGREFSFEATPTKVGNTLYFCTPHRKVFAVDATTGAQKWVFDPHPDTAANTYLACRGVAYFEAPQGTPCPRRILTTTADAQEHLIALDADTGRLCQGFGDGGRVSLTANLGPSPPGFHFISSEPLVLNNRVLLGGWVYDNQSEDEPSGVIRAFDPVTGQLAWAWDMGRQPDPTAPLKPGEVWTRGTPNGWGTYTADPALNLAYIPLGNATPDYYGKNRRPFDETYSSAVVALDITTGRERWHYQTVHHDLWDFDLPIGPSLIDLPGPGGPTIPALVQTTKQGQIFLLDRRDGHPLADVQERPVPKGSIPDEPYAPTQPYSVGMPNLTPAKLTEADTWGTTPIDQMICRIQFRRMKYDGLFTPPDQQGNIGYPAFDGVIDWYGASIDPARRVLIANTSYIPFTYQLVPMQQALARGLVKPWSGWSQTPYPKTSNFSINPQYGTPYVALIYPWLSPISAPCTRPPWGLLTAIDLDHRAIAWQRPIGTTEDMGPAGLRMPFGLPTGIFSMGGSVVTGGGLIFVAATSDQYLRAFDERSGTLLWQARLPAGGQATPITYVGADGRQYVVLCVGGHGGLRTRNGDDVMAWALPKT